MTEDEATSLCLEVARELDAENLQFADATQVCSEVFRRLSRRVSAADAGEAVFLWMLGEDLARKLRK